MMSTRFSLESLLLRREPDGREEAEKEECREDGALETAGERRSCVLSGMPSSKPGIAVRGETRT